MTGYNGTLNYETWNVSLWLSNNADEYVTEMALSAWARTDGDMDAYKYELAGAIKAFVTDDEIGMFGIQKATGGPATMASDLLTAALSEVNWHEIAEAWEENPRSAFGDDGE